MTVKVNKSVSKLKGVQKHKKIAKGHVNIKHPDGSEEDQDIAISRWQVVESPEDLFQVGFDASFTKNLGNYESTKLSTSIVVPANYEGLDDAFDFCVGWVNTKMTKAISELLEK